MRYRTSVLRSSVDKNDLLTLILDLKDAYAENQSIQDKLKKQIKILDEILREKIGRETK